MQAITSCPTLCPGQVLKVTGGEEVAGEFADGVLVTAMHSHARRDADFAVVCRHTGQPGRRLPA
jgi:type VI secretion system secreted protein VgrG